LSAPPTPSGTDGGTVVPGELIPGDGPIVLNAGRPVLTLAVVNTGDRPVQVGSHYHFAEANPALDFDRSAAWGHRLAVAAGTSVRFEPGVDREVDLVPLGGRRVVAGLRGECAGPVDERRPSTGTAAGGTAAGDSDGDEAGDAA